MNFMDSNTKLRELHQLADHLQSIRDEITTRQMEINAEVDKFQERINGLFEKVYFAIKAIEMESQCYIDIGAEYNYGDLDCQQDHQLTTKEDEVGDEVNKPTNDTNEDDEFAEPPPPKLPRVDFNDKSKKVLEDKELIALEEAKIPAQLAELSSTKFPKTVDWKNPEIYHGLLNIISGGKLIHPLILGKTHECICGMKFERYKRFINHFNCNSTSTSVDYTFRCSVCGMNCPDGARLIRHRKTIHGISQEGSSEIIKVDDEELLALEEGRIAAQLAHLSTTTYKQVADWRSPSIFHGLKNILSDGKIIDATLSKTYECWCGVKFEKHNDFQKHYLPHARSKNKSFRCSLCGKGLKESNGLQSHMKAVHGACPQKTEENSTNETDPGRSARKFREMLVTWRDQTSKLLNVTPYCVLLDSQLEFLAENPPSSKELLCHQLGEPHVELLGNFIHTLFRLLSWDGERFFEEMQGGPGIQKGLSISGSKRSKELRNLQQQGVGFITL